jgi:methylated-DNA-[protein]-cysteine S-methyltransferase
MTYFTSVGSPLGKIMLCSDGENLTGLFLATTKHAPERAPNWQQCDHLPIFIDARDQLSRYFVGERSNFNLPLKMEGTAFQKMVWLELTKIPYGTTISYGELAKRIGNPKAQRAVGLANGRNPISIIVPCHRVIGADGSLTGYGGGIVQKQALLALEEKMLNLDFLANHSLSRV